MKQIPSSWSMAPIGDLCDLKNGRAFKPTEWTTEGLPIVRIQNLNNKNASFNYYSGEYEEKYYLNGGELLFAWSGTPGTSFGAHVWRGGKALLNQHIFRVDFDKEFLDHRLFRHAINQQLTLLISKAHGGAGLQHVTKGKFEATEIAVPPIHEQRRIADKLDTTLARVDALNDRLARITPLLKRFRQSVLAAATSGRLTEDVSNLFGKEKNNSWELKSIESIADVIDPHPSHRTPPEILGGVPYVSIGDINEQGNIDFEKARKVSPVILEEHKSRYLIENGDFIFGKIGTIGKPTKIPINIEYTISANVILIKPKKELVNPDYLRYVFSSINFLADIAKKSVATSQAAFGIKKMRSLQIKIPTLEEQTEIVRRVETLFAFADRLEARLQSAQTAAERLTPALLAKAFRGELVPQDPNDEPATELLRRLRQARAAQVPTKKPRKTTTARA